MRFREGAYMFSWPKCLNASTCLANKRVYDHAERPYRSVSGNRLAGKACSHISARFGFIVRCNPGAEAIAIASRPHRFLGAACSCDLCLGSPD